MAVLFKSSPWPDFILVFPTTRGDCYETAHFGFDYRCRQSREFLAFYRDGLGLPTEGIIGREFEHGAVAFFTLSGRLKLAIWAQDDLAYDTGLPKTPISSTSFTIGHNVVRREEVDQVMDETARAGAEIIKPARDTFFGGYAGYFRDPNGHLWEVVWNPANIPSEGPF
ncbi:MULTISPECIES: VOC family protein [unclassified Mesorhizobium]|uniref:VOC family protein n=1 Tax=unclassified Mesorhizobium TaxID=325217 RepID=UPI003339E9F7